MAPTECVPLIQRSAKMDVRPVFFKEIGFFDFLEEWCKSPMTQQSGFEKEEPKRDSSFPKQA
jgi:hypothetical protein